MSVNLSIKGVPDALAETLRQRAARNHRSLQGELMAILEAAATETGAPCMAVPAAGPSLPDRLRGLMRPVRGSKSLEQIAAEHRLRFPEPIPGGPLSVDIIREMRDSR